MNSLPGSFWYRSLLALVLATVTLTAAAQPTAERLKARMVLQYGSTFARERTVLDYTEDTSSTTGFQAPIIPVEIAASGTDTQVNLASFVDTATYIAIKDRNGTGFKVALSASNKFQVAANGVFVFKNGASTPPTLYLDNVSTTEKAFLEISILGTSS